MGLHTILKKLKRKEKEIRVLILGLDSWQDDLLKRSNGEDTSEVSPHACFNIKTLGNRGFRLNMWDVGGQKSLRGYWRNYFESTDAIIWVVDSADRRRLGTVTANFGRSPARSLLVLANKQDLPGAMPPDQIAEMLELSAIGSLHWKMLGCSAFTGMEGLLDGIDWMLDDLSRRLYYMD
ncbi:hypothetical protein HPB49_008824 [Dermacentor silvarum]|uniref:Uncharacterized protein n=1 Tax=Dermacentor silvarum TaxID=543639 RepID=A0ACB8CE99_DERSI|nr:hypothetical protein HPB49_008824 [Dermacentor silvarum]